MTLKKISNYKFFARSNNFLLLPNSYDIVYACLKFKFEDLGCLNFLIFKCQTSPNVLLSNFCNDATRFLITFSTERLKTFISQCRSLIHLLKKIWKEHFCWNILSYFIGTVAGTVGPNRGLIRGYRYLHSNFNP